MLEKIIYDKNKGINSFSIFKMKICLNIYVIDYYDLDKYHDCAICLKEFDDGEYLQKIPNCDHLFHEDCLRNWFK